MKGHNRINRETVKVEPTEDQEGGSAVLWSYIGNSTHLKYNASEINQHYCFIANVFIKECGESRM